MSRLEWGVVGGGMLGMAISLRLADQGHRVTLIEGSSQLGGLAAPWEIGNVTWDRHYHVIVNSDLHLLALLDRIGLGAEVHWRETRTGVLAGGRLFSVSNALEYLRFPPLNMVDKARMAWTILYASRISDWKALENVPVAEWLRRHSGGRALERFWLPLLRSKLGENYQRTSAAFIWTTIQRLYSARRGGLRREMFGYVPGGYARIISHLGGSLDRAGVTTALGSPVRRVAADQGHVRVEFDDDAMVFDRVVVTAASPVAARLIAGLSADESAAMSSVEYQGVVCASMLSRRGLGGFYVTNITDPAPFTGIIEMSTLVDSDQLGGHHLIYLPRYTSPGDDVIDLDDEELEDRFVSALTKMFPGFGRSDVVAFRVSRVPYVLPIPTVGYSARVPAMATSVPGVFSVSSAQIINGTLNVNETLQLAARALPVITGEVAYRPEILEADVAPILSGS